MKLLLKNLLLIFIFSFENSETYKGQCPHRSQMKTRATWVCESNPLENYSCLYGTNGSVESCIDKADYAAPGKRYVLKENPHPENCPIYKYQPYKLWSNRSSDCEFIKSECSELGQIMCGIGTTITDLTCRCDHRRGYAFLTTPRNVSLCEPTVEDCSCFLKICDENMILASDYTCKPSQYFNEHMTCVTLPDQDDNQVNASQTNLKVQTEERRNMFNSNHLIGIIITTVMIVIITFPGVIYVIYKLCYTPLPSVEVFTRKIQRNFKMLKKYIDEHTEHAEEQLVKCGLITKGQIEIESMQNNAKLLLIIATNSETILEKQASCLKCISEDDGLIYEILKMNLIDVPSIPKPSEDDVRKQIIQLEKQRENLLYNLDGRSLVYDFVEKFIFDFIDFKYIIHENTSYDINERFLEKVQSKLHEGTYWLLQTLLEENNRTETLALLKIQDVPMPLVSCICCKINDHIKDQLACIRLEIKLTEQDDNSLINETIKCRINSCNAILLQGLALSSVEKNGGVYKPLRGLSINILNRFARLGGLTKIVKKLVCNDDVQRRITSGTFQVEALLKRDSVIENSNEYRDFTAETNDAGCNVISVNRKFIMDEMDTQVALEALKRERFDISQILGDRTEKLTDIVKILENETEKYLDTLLEVLQECKMNRLFQRLKTSKETFSVNIDEQDLIGSFCEHVFLVVWILKEKDTYTLIKDDLIEREITFRTNGEVLHDTSDLDEIILNIITTVMKRGRNAMLNFVDVLYKFNKTQIANDLLYSVPTHNRNDERECFQCGLVCGWCMNSMTLQSYRHTSSLSLRNSCTEKDSNLHMESLQNDVLLHGHFNLTVPVENDRNFLRS